MAKEGIVPKFLKSNRDLDAIWGLRGVKVDIGDVFVEDYCHDVVVELT